MAKPIRKIERPKPVSELVLERLRDDIIQNKFALGEKISEASLSELYGVTKAPIRAAYIRLETEGLITIRPQSGTFVFELSLQELRHLCELRVALESEALRLAFRRNPDGLRHTVTGIVHDMEIALEVDDLTEYRRLDDLLHNAFFALIGNPLLAEVYKARVSGPFSALRTRFGTKRVHNENSRDEHQALMQAIQDNDPEEAMKLLRDHINIAESYYTSVMLE